MRPLANRSPATIAAIGAASIALTLAVGRLVGSTGPRADGPEVATARLGTLDIVVETTGRLIAPRSVTIASEIQSNRAKVVRLAAEGTTVAAGELLVEFDATPFEEAVTKLGRAVREAEANQTQVEQDLGMQRAKAEQASSDAEMRRRLAALELQTLEEGGQPLSVKEGQMRVAQSRAQLDRARQEAADAQAFLDQGFITRKEFAETAARFADAERFHELAAAQLDNQLRFHGPAELERRRAALERAERDVDAAKDLATRQVRRLEAQHEKSQMAVEAARADLARAELELERTQIHAPSAGFLVYDEIPVGSEYRKLQIGDSVWQGQAIMTIPDTSQMAVASRVREYDVHDLRPGQSVRVQLEAFPGEELRGRVEYIGNLANDAGEGREQYFSLRVLLDPTELDLRPGMTARLAIEVETIADALLVPVPAVYVRDGQTMAAVLEGGEFVERRLQIGRGDANSVQVLAGLEAGESLRLAPMAGAAGLPGR